jgi:hypothetical protein
MLVLLEIVAGVVVVLFAGGLMALHRDRIRSLGVTFATAVAGEKLASDMEGDTGAHGGSPPHDHPNEAHWEDDSSH